MTITEEIIAIANTLADQGKKPSIALIRAHLSQSVALPTIVSVLNSWQYQPNRAITEQVGFERVAINYDLHKNDSVSLLIEQVIAQALKPVYQELNEIKTLIKRLNKN